MKYFVDANLIIDTFNKKKNVSDEKRQTIEHARNILIPVLQDDDSEVFINRLVYLEVLRYTDDSEFKTLKQALEGFTILDINQTIYDDAVNLSRYCKTKGITIKGRCAAIDFLHFMTAQYYGLKLLAIDGDMKTLQEYYLLLLPLTTGSDGIFIPS